MQQEDKEELELTDQMYRILLMWVVEKDKKAVFNYFTAQSPFYQRVHLEVLESVLLTSPHEKIRQAAKDIPIYIKQQLALPQKD